MSQPDTFPCPHCGKALRHPGTPLPPDGAHGTCPYCKQPIHLGVPEAARPPFAVKRPDGSIEELAQTEIEDRIRSGEVFRWDHISKDDGQFLPACEHDVFTALFTTRDTLIQTHCWDHHGRPTAKHCRQCGRGFCANCVPRPERIEHTLLTCPACEGILDSPDPRLREKPFWRRLDEVFLYPIKDYSWVTTVLVGFFLGLASSGVGVIRPRAFLIIPICLAFIVHAINRSAKGDKKMTTGPDISDPLELAGMGFTAILVTVVAIAPLVLVNVFVVYRGLAEGETPGAVVLLNLPLIVLAIAYYPMALGMTAVWHNRWLALRPDIVFAHALKIQKDYGILLAYCTGITVLQWIVESVGAQVPFLGGIGAGIVSAYFGFVEAHMIGWTLYMNVDELGWS